MSDKEKIKELENRNDILLKCNLDLINERTELNISLSKEKDKFIDISNKYYEQFTEVIMLREFKKHFEPSSYFESRNIIEEQARQLTKQREEKDILQKAYEALVSKYNELVRKYINDLSEKDCPIHKTPEVGSDYFELRELYFKQKDEIRYLNELIEKIKASKVTITDNANPGRNGTYYLIKRD